MKERRKPKVVIKHESAAAHGDEATFELRRSRVRKKKPRLGPSLNSLVASAAFACTGTRRLTPDGKFLLRDKKEPTPKEIADAIKDVALRLAARAARIASKWDMSVPDAVDAACRGEGDPEK